MIALSRGWAPHILAVAFVGGLIAGVWVAPAQGNEHGPQPLPIVFDNDADFDDTAALAALVAQVRAGRIDLKAVTITNNGGGLPGKGYQHMRCLLDQLGLPDVPVADATY